MKKIHYKKSIPNLEIGREESKKYEIYLRPFFAGHLTRWEVNNLFGFTHPPPPPSVRSHS